MTDSLQAGVIGVGSMGQHHARVYKELQEVTLAGVTDADAERANEVAARQGIGAYPLDTLLEAIDLASIAVPTDYHYELARACIERGVDVLVEKPFVADPEQGQELIELADEHDVLIGVGHVERYNPAVAAAREVLADTEIIAADARRLGPPLDRDIEDSAVLDLMIHDIDVLLSLVGSEIETVNALGTRENRYIDAQMRFADSTVASLTASRVTQEKVRELSITAADCWITVDYLDQSVEVHRGSSPEYVERDGDVRYRHEGIVERPMVESGEPLGRELAAFLRAVRERRTPVVSAADGLAALQVAGRIEELATRSRDRPGTEFTPLHR
ncbi:gfo/Idh/MocA family oxidoreductase [Halobacteriales archaeon QS_3_64_16]|nr:MAG: gfo/Idh/MocA family oxidoreductase [Halobacteriales archaeon QS_3_64_16]